MLIQNYSWYEYSVCLYIKASLSLMSYVKKHLTVFEYVHDKTKKIAIVEDAKAKLSLSCHIGVGENFGQSIEWFPLNET